jgi:hypothetical protein
MKPEVQLTGQDGNVFAIIGKCRNAAKEFGWRREEIAEFTNKILDCESYDAALQIVMQNFEVS